MSNGTTTINTPVAGSNVTIPVSVVIFAGLGLFVVANLSNGDMQKLWNLVFSGKFDSNTRGILLKQGGELLFIFIAGFLAETGQDAENLILALFVGLWFGWAMMHGQSLQNWNKLFLKG